MAIYRLAAQVLSRSKGRSATAAAAYRAGERIEDERTGLAYDYRAKSGVLHAEIMAPANAPEWMRDRAQLWNAVELAEKRKDAQLCREVQLALPHELDEAQRVRLVRDFVAAQFVAKGMIADVAIHAPDRDSDERNHHAHILLTMRVLTADGFGPKERAWNGKPELEAWREEWERCANGRLREAGSAERIDHRSLEAQGIGRTPAMHEGPAVREMEARGMETDRGSQNRARQANDNEIRQAEAELRAINGKLDRLRRMQAVARHADAIWRHAETPPEERQREPEPKPEPPPVRPASRAESFLADLRQRAQERAQQEGAPRERDDDRGSGRDR